MSKPKMRWWESGRNLGFAGTVAAGLVLAFIIYLVGFVPVLAWFQSVWRWVIQPIPVPLALLVLMVAMLAVIAARAASRLRQPPPPAWLNYTHDTLLGIVWRWQYDGTHLVETSIRAFCPQCGTAVRGEQHGYMEMTTSFICDECHFSQQIPGSGLDVLNRIARLIEREANRKAQSS